MKNLTKFIIAIIVAAGVILLIIRSCSDQNVPPDKANADSFPALSPSVIMMPVSISGTDLERVIRDKIQSPVEHYQSPELSVKLSALEPDSSKVWGVVKDATVGRYITEIKMVPTSVTHSLKSLWHLRIWKAIEDVATPVTTFIAPEKAVYGWVARPVTKFLDKVYPVRSTLYCDIYINDLSISLNGNTVKVVVSTRTNIRADYQQATVPLGPAIKIKGLLNFDVLNTVTITGDLNINDQLSIDLNLNSDDSKLEFTKIGTNFAITGLNLATYTNPVWFAYKKALTKLVHDQMLKTINDKVADFNGKFSLKDKVASYADTINRPREIKKDIWLLPGVSEAYLSGLDSYQLNGQSFLKVNIGLKATPQILYSETKPKVDPEKITLKKAIVKDGVAIRLQIALDYLSAADTIKNGLNGIIKEKLGGWGLGVKAVKVYPSLNSLAVGISFTYKNKNLATVYFSGIPRFDNLKNQFSADSMTYYAGSENILISGVSALASKIILNYMQTHAKWSAPPTFQNIKETLTHLQIASDTGVLLGSLNSSVDSISVGKKNLTASFYLTGTMQYQVKRLALIKIGFDHLQPNTATVGKKIVIDLYKPGDTIKTVGADKKLSWRISTFKDTHLPGDTIWYELNHVPKYYIFSQADVSKKQLIIN